MRFRRLSSASKWRVPGSILARPAGLRFMHCPRSPAFAEGARLGRSVPGPPDCLNDAYDQWGRLLITLTAKKVAGPRSQGECGNRGRLPCSTGFP